MTAEVILEKKSELDDGTRYEIKALSVEVDEQFEEGLKYSFQYMENDGTNILRYDNARHQGTDIPYHHKHVGADEEIEPVEFERNILEHKNKFLREIGVR